MAYYQDQIEYDRETECMPLKKTLEEYQKELAERMLLK